MFPTKDLPPKICPVCNELFFPRIRSNRYGGQVICGKPECRKAKQDEYQARSAAKVQVRYRHSDPKYILPKTPDLLMALSPDQMGMVDHQVKAIYRGFLKTMPSLEAYTAAKREYRQQRKRWGNRIPRFSKADYKKIESYRPKNGTRYLW